MNLRHAVAVDRGFQDKSILELIAADVEFAVTGCRDVRAGDHTIGKKIRMHRKFQPAYMLILGDDEANNNTVSIRARNGDQRAGVSFDSFLSELLQEIDNKVATPSLVPSKEE